MIKGVIYFAVSVYVLNRILYNYEVTYGNRAIALITHPVLSLRYNSEVCEI